MTILTGFPPSNTVQPYWTWTKPKFDKDNPTKEQIEALKAWYYGPSSIRVKWKEIVPENKETE